MFCEATSATAPRLLVIDDDPALRRVVANVARGAGFDVTDCDGDADLDSCLEQHADMIILDLVMPVRDGIEVIERLATAHGLKVAAVFTKPFSNAELRSCLHEQRGALNTGETARLRRVPIDVRASRIEQALAARDRAQLHPAGARSSWPSWRRRLAAGP